MKFPVPCNVLSSKAKFINSLLSAAADLCVGRLHRSAGCPVWLGRNYSCTHSHWLHLTMRVICYRDNISNLLIYRCFMCTAVN